MILIEEDSSSEDDVVDDEDERDPTAYHPTIPAQKVSQPIKRGIGGIRFV